MAFDIKPTGSTAVDEVLTKIGRLSAADRRKFFRAIRAQEMQEDLQWFHKVWGRVSLTDTEIAEMVNDVRSEMHATDRTNEARR
ncbi:MAG: hypothetical protein KF843_15155 [Flavobacteriales bacterium]|nr:hypothetical protein [Flavobacteriales bacterium]